MPASPDDQLPPMAIAMQWVSRITSISLMMVLPALGGYWCDEKFGTGPWLLIAGALLGAVLAATQLFQLVILAKPGRTGGDRNQDRPG